MKKAFLTGALVCSFLTALQAQTVAGVPVKDLSVDFVQIVGTSRPFSNKLTVEIDFGQENKLFSSDKDTRIKEANGRNKVFNSIIDALNFMSANGYDFVQAFAFVKDNLSVTHYLLKNKKP